MRKHFELWIDFAKSLGIDLREEDMCFVYGATKTRDWTVAAFDGNSDNRGAAINVSLGYAGLGASVGLSMSTSNQSALSYSYRTGPSDSNRRYVLGQSHPAGSSSPSPTHSFPSSPLPSLLLSPLSPPEPPLPTSLEVQRTGTSLPLVKENIPTS